MREEEESFVYLFKCYTSTFELLHEEASVNVSLSLVEFEGNSYLDLSFCFLYIGEYTNPRLMVVLPLPYNC